MGVQRKFVRSLAIVFGKEARPPTLDAMTEIFSVAGKEQKRLADRQKAPFVVSSRHLAVVQRWRTVIIQGFSDP
jgi:hypothetical protein